MPTATALWDFETTVVNTAMVGSVSAGAPFTVATMTRAGSPASWSLYNTYFGGYGGYWLSNSHSGSNANTRMLGSWVQMVVTPVAGKVFTPTTLEFDASGVNSGQIQWQVDVNGAFFASGVTSGATSPNRNHITVDLSSLGQKSTAQTIKVYWTNNFDSFYSGAINDLKFSATYPDPAANITATGIASAEAFGGAQVIAVPPTQEIFPDGIASMEAFGDLQVIPDLLVFPEGIVSEEAFGFSQVFTPDVYLLVAGIPSATAFGDPLVGITTPEVIVDYPTGLEVTEFAGVPIPVPQADESVSIITSLARGYTRGNGFFAEGVKPELRDVIVVATARLLSNPDQVDITVGSVRRASFFKGWTLAEQRILNHYRKVAF